MPTVRSSVERTLRTGPVSVDTFKCGTVASGRRESEEFFTTAGMELVMDGERNSWFFVLGTLKCKKLKSSNLEEPTVFGREKVNDVGQIIGNIKIKDL
ncbi:hypothetical protein Trydic_g14349 [Trypoxylus dichotomus]